MRPFTTSKKTKTPSRETTAAASKATFEAHRLSSTTASAVCVCFVSLLTEPSSQSSLTENTSPTNSRTASTSARAPTELASFVMVSQRSRTAAHSPDSRFKAFGVKELRAAATIENNAALVTSETASPASLVNVWNIASPSVSLACATSTSTTNARSATSRSSSASRSETACVRLTNAIFSCAASTFPRRLANFAVCSST
mmetsp:Transcript_1121/g.3677  ORF Transcript_1121/g.3677 Transcript_1121/m.3677 type:complete len:200 (+) Transcript_1121:783-1382(+)